MSGINYRVVASVMIAGIIAMLTPIVVGPRADDQVWVAIVAIGAGIITSIGLAAGWIVSAINKLKS